ncbi:hypothetical protein OIU78_029752 [Salix suchowensis]|nr:hypothetical protein OIU78_029752 [Salix suchowensis]
MTNDVVFIAGASDLCPNGGKRPRTNEVRDFGGTASSPPSPPPLPMSFKDKVSADFGKAGDNMVIEDEDYIIQNGEASESAEAESMKDVTGLDKRAVEIENLESTQTEQVLGVAVSAVVTWNVRGAGKVKCASTIKDFKKIYAIDVFAVLKPRISGSKALNVAINLGFSHYHIVDAIRLSRGVWLLYNGNTVSLQVIVHASQSITALFNVQNKC